MNDLDSTSTRPYLIRALYEWCTDNGLTPYVAVMVDQSVQVPREYVKNNEIVLNISFDATSSLKLGNEFIEFKARFAGSAREIVVPISRVIAIYARENGQGMAFPSPAASIDEAGREEPLAGEPVSRVLAPTAVPEPLAPEGRVIQFVNDALQPAGEPSPPTVAPEPPKPPPGPRPSLKRVK
jgi:stringent starvation protein B